MRNFFKILTREESVETNNLRNILSNFGDVEVIPDIKGNLEGYTGMCGDIRQKNWQNATTAWDLLFKGLADEYTWVIEDDVAFNHGTIKNILNGFKDNESDLVSNRIYSKHEDPQWPWWNLKDSLKDIELWHSLNCFCRVSPSLIKKVEQYRDRHGGFTFHEMLLPSLAETRTDFRESHFGSYFDNFSCRSSEIDLDTVMVNKVYHPVKSDDKHSEICHYK